MKKINKTETHRRNTPYQQTKTEEKKKMRQNHFVLCSLDR